LINIEIDEKYARALSIYLMESLHQIAVLKNNSIILDPLIDIKTDDVIKAIKEFIKNNNIEAILLYKNKKIHVNILKDSSIENNNEELLTCPHCGKVSIYEEEMNIHIKIHYIGL